MFLTIVTIASVILGLILVFIGAETDSVAAFTVGLMLLLIFLGLSIFGCFHGFINYPRTEGTHTGIISAVDLEGVYFRRYEVYLKVSNYTTQGDETIYRIYENEPELAEKLKGMVGKQVKITYGHDGGYIGWKSCGTYHIKNVEVVEEIK